MLLSIFREPLKVNSIKRSKSHILEVTRSNVIMLVSLPVYHAFHRVVQRYCLLFVYLLSIQTIILLYFATNVRYAFYNKDFIYLVCQMTRNCANEEEMGLNDVGRLRKRTLRILDK